MDPTPSPSEDVTTQPPTQDPGRPVGKVLDVIQSLARVQGERVGSGHNLFQGNELSTDARGLATFSVGDVLEDCQLQSETDLKVAPSVRTPVEVQRGSIICRSKEGDSEFEVPAGGAIVQFLDPIFLVTVAGPTTDVRVNFGFVQVKKAAGGSPRIIGPGGQMIVGDGALPARAAQFDANRLDPANAVALRRLRSGLPAEPQGFPRRSTSKTLNQMRSVDTLRLGLDDDAESSEAAFTQELFGKVAGRWETGIDVVDTDTEEAAQDLQSGAMDVYVSPNPVPGAARLLLFADGSRQEREWYMWVRPDQGFEADLQALIKRMLNTGEYGDTYAGAFDLQPNYEKLRSLVYPSAAQSGRSLWLKPSATFSPVVEAEVGDIELSVDPEEYLGKCPTVVTVTGTIEIERPGEVDYEYRLKDGNAIGARNRKFDKAGTYSLQSQAIRVGTSTEGSVRLEAPDANAASQEAAYSVTCD